MVSVSPGDSVWAFTRRSTDGLYVLAAELVVCALTRNPPIHREGYARPPTSRLGRMPAAPGTSHATVVGRSPDAWAAESWKEALA